MKGQQKLKDGIRLETQAKDAATDGMEKRKTCKTQRKNVVMRNHKYLDLLKPSSRAFTSLTSPLFGMIYRPL